MDKKFTLKQKIVLITGASSGIGEACAHAFAEQGANLILAARRLDRLTKISGDISDKFNVKCHFMLLDVRERDEIAKFVNNLPEDFKNIDILVNNAGLASGMSPIQEGDFSDWDRMIDTNIKGLLNITRLVVPGMIDRGAGHIINIGSIAGRQVYPQGGVYCASKFAVSAISQGLAIDLLDTPVRVSSVDPGLAETEFALVRFAGDESRAKQVYEGMTPLTSQDVADAVLYVGTRPPHVNISDMLIVPADQASAYHVHRDENYINKTERTHRITTNTLRPLNIVMEMKLRETDGIKQTLTSMCHEIGKIRQLLPAKITFSELAFEIGVSHNQLYKWMKGQIPSRKSQSKIINLWKRIDEHPESFNLSKDA